MKLTAVRSHGAGPDGFSLTGEVDGRPVLVHRLAAELVSNPVRRRRLERRLALAQTLTARGVLGAERLLNAALDHEPAVIVVEFPAIRPLATCASALSATPLLALHLLQQVCAPLVVLHAQGLPHGALSAHSISVLDDNRAWLSVLALDTGTVPGGLVRTTVDDADRLSSLQGCAADVAALGEVCALLATGSPAMARAVVDDPTAAAVALPGAGGLLELSRAMLDHEPAWRPPIAEVLRRLNALLATSSAAPTVTDDTPPRPATPALRDDVDGLDTPRRLGRYVLKDRLGAGAMGEVWRALDDDTGDTVALKVLGSATPSAKALKRFKKEARLLSEVQHPGIARFVDAGEHDGLLYLVTELVEGQPLSTVIKANGPHAEREALLTIADVCRALVDVHNAGIVHRDIKPENLMVPTSGPLRVRLIDFGVARHLDEEGSLAMTRQGAVLGTPLYMSPEQASGRSVDARSDLYAVGTMLYELLVGRAPFAGRGVAQVMAMQIEAPAPPVRELRADISDEVNALVARCLEKNPDDRFQSAGELLQAILPLVGLAPTPAISSSPTPATRQRYEFVFELQASPKALWPYVSNTDRLNRAIGLSQVEEHVEHVGDDVHSFGRQRQAGFMLAWREHPYEWVYERRLAVEREYTEGPLRRFSSRVELVPHDGGTRLTQTIEIEPRGLVGRAAAAIEVGVRTKGALKRTYERIDQLVSGKLGTSNLVDAFEPAQPLRRDVEDRFTALERQAVTRGAEPRAMATIGEWLRAAPTPELARIRPIALARRLKLPVNVVVDACFYAGAVGLLSPLWDVLCPTCRVPSSMQDTLKALREHGTCDVCRVRFALDLATSIELVFRIHPSLRDAQPETWCISSPAHTPHVVAQVRLGVGERTTLDLAVPEGSYVFAGRMLGWSRPLRVRPQAPTTRWDLTLSSPPSSSSSMVLGEGRQLLELHNDTDRAQLVRLERTTPRDDVLTASRVLSSPLFKRLYPHEVLADDAMVRVGSVIILIVEPVFAHREHVDIEQLYSLYRRIDEVVTRHEGAVVRLHGDGVLSVFHDAAAAVQAVTSLRSSSVTIRAALHRGPAGAVTLNERLDYFGTSIQEAIALVGRARGGELLVSDAVADERSLAVARDAGAVLATISTLDDVGYRLQLA
jgi:serine/threonine protein kinase